MLQQNQNEETVLKTVRPPQGPLIELEKQSFSGPDIVKNSPAEILATNSNGVAQRKEIYRRDLASNSDDFEIERKEKGSFYKILKALASGPLAYANIGQIVVSIPYSLSGLIVKSVVAIFTTHSAIRTALQPEREKAQNDDAPHDSPKTFFSGVFNLFKSPGMFAVMGAFSRIAMGVEAVARGFYLPGIGSLIGLGSVIPLTVMLNSEYWEKNNIKYPLGERASRAWGNLPRGFRTCFTSVAPFWCIENVCYGIAEIPITTLSTVNPGSIFYVTALAFGLGGVGASLYAGITKRIDINKLPMTLGALEFFSYSVSNFYAGSWYQTIGFAFFGLASSSVAFSAFKKKQPKIALTALDH